MPTNHPHNPAGRVALITGAARRVGRAVAICLADAGFDIALTYRTSALQADEVVERIRERGRRAVAFQVDLSQPDAAEHLHGRLTAQFARLDALINNAAMFWPRAIGDVDVATFDHFHAVNARAPFMLMQRFAPMLAAHHRASEPASTGRIVNFVDIHAMGEPMKGYAPYNASKAALLELTRTCAVELGPAVTVNAVAPGVVAWASDFDEAHKQQYLDRVPLARAGTPEDAARAVRFLVCDAHYTTGQVLRVDGGRALA